MSGKPISYFYNNHSSTYLYLWKYLSMTLTCAVYKYSEMNTFLFAERGFLVENWTNFSKIILKGLVFSRKSKPPNAKEVCLRKILKINRRRSGLVAHYVFLNLSGLFAGLLSYVKIYIFFCINLEGCILASEIFWVNLVGLIVLFAYLGAL